MIFIKQCKGKDLSKVAKSKLQKGLYYVSKKYDGNYVQIHKIGNEVIFFSSGGIRFYLENIAKQLVFLNDGVNFVLEAEYIADTDGSLGSRGACTTTTFRTNTKKGIENTDTLTKRFMVFDCIYYHDSKHFRTAQCPSERNFEYRKLDLGLLNLGQNLLKVEHHLIDFDVAVVSARAYVDNGGEGFFAIKAFHQYEEGKRTNDAIKIKFYPTVWLKCTGTKRGDGKYFDMIGSLDLVDENGITVNVGGGLSDELRAKSPDYFIDRMIKIEYESFDKTYVQLRYKDIR